MTNTVTDDGVNAAEPRSAIDAGALAQLFTDAHTYSAWRDDDVSLALIRELYELVRWAPTSMNSNPARFVFLCSDEAKERLRPHLDEKNVKQTMTAPCCAIVAEDVEFLQYMDRLVPARPNVRELLATEPDSGPEAEPSEHDDAERVPHPRRPSARPRRRPDAGLRPRRRRCRVLPDRRWKSSLLVNLGYGAEPGTDRETPGSTSTKPAASSDTATDQGDPT